MMAFLKFKITFILVLITGALLASEIDNLQFSCLTKENGLTDNVVTCIYQDSYGFIWFGTKGGINKFDGYNFFNYRYIKGDSTSLIGNEVHNFIISQKNELFIATHRGVNIYNSDLNNFSACKYELKDGGKNIYTNDLILSNTGEVMSLSTNKVWLYDSITSTLRYYKTLEPFTESFYKNFGDANTLFQDSRNKFWIGGQFGLLYCDSLDSKVNSIINKAIFTINANEPRVQFFSQLTETSIMICTSAGVFIIDWDIQASKNLTHLFPEMDVEEALIEGDNYIFATKGYGLVTYNKKENVVNRFMKDQDNVQSINDNNLKTAFRDIQGNLWVGTYESGINVSYKKTKGFNRISYKAGNSNSLSSANVKSLKLDNDENIWFGVDGGINKYNRDKKQFTHYLYNSKNENTIPNATLRIETTNDYVYAGGWSTGLCQFNKETNQVKQYLFNPVLNHLNNYVRKILCDSKGNIWVTSDGNGLQLFNEQTETFTSFVQNKNLPENSIVSNSLTCLYEDSKGRIWIGGFGGVSILDLDTWTFTNLIKNESDNSLASDWVFSIYECSNGLIYIGTSEGMSVYNENQNLFTNYTDINGLVNNFIHAFVEDDQGNIWIGTKNGISKFNPEKKSFKNFYKHDGLHGNEVSYSAYDKAADGTIYFGGKGGVTYFKPSDIETNKFKPSVVLTELKINYKTVLPKVKGSPLTKHISKTQAVVLSHKQNIINFSFVAINYINASQNLYSYSLEGFDNEFTRPDYKKEATYTNLDPGEYTFKVKASNNDEVWNEEGVSLKITVLPPWWKTWYFRIGLSLFILLVAWVAYVLRVKVLKEQKRVLKLKVKQRTEDLEMAYVELENKQNEIQQRNEELVTSEEELQQLNEELTTTNDQLYHQKEELETTLNSLKETQSQLVQSEKMASLGILTSGIAHEINNPLNFIQGGKTTLQLFIEDNYPDNSDEFNPFIEMIDEGINRAAKIVQGLNRFNRKNDDYNEECNVHDIIENCLLMLHNQVNYNIEIFKKYSKEQLIIIGNEGDLHQVFINIIANATQAIDEKGTVILKTKIAENNEAIIKISDTGRGISNENIEKITAPFYTTKPPGEGTGLGMSIAYSIIKKHCGSIHYISEIGKGTTVTLTFPVK